jgi:hypothetical protein
MVDKPGVATLSWIAAFRNGLIRTMIASRLGFESGVPVNAGWNTPGVVGRSGARLANSRTEMNV